MTESDTLEWTAYKRNATEYRGISLAMDTSGDICSVAALRFGKIVSEHAFRHAMHLSERLMPHIAAVLTEADAGLNDVEHFAVGIGPGSFTGTRIGVTTAKTLAWVMHRPIYGICGLEALAIELSGTPDIVVPVLPCRKETVYAGIYRVAETWPELLSAPAARTIPELTDDLRNVDGRSIVFCGEGVEMHRESLLRVAPAGRIMGFGRGRSPFASLVGVLAWRRVLTGDPGEDVLAIAPQYISPPPITLPRTGTVVNRIEA